MRMNFLNTKRNHTSATANLLLILLLSCSTLSFGQDTSNTISEDSLLDANVQKWANSDQHENKPFPVLFEGISKSAIEENYNAIQTSRSIGDYRIVPDPRTGKVNYSQVSDPHTMLSDWAIDTLDAIMKKVEDETSYQMAVVCLNSIDGQNPNQFGTDLFNYWGIGEAGKDNGFLMLVINDVHRVEFINGRGTEVILTDLQGEDIRQHEMIPHFRQNDYVTGIIRGVQAVANVFYGSPIDYSTQHDPYANEINYEDDYDLDFTNSYDRNYSNSFWDNKFIRIYGSISLGLGVISFFFLLIALFIKDLHKRYHLMKFFTLLIFPILFPIPFLALYFLYRWLMNRWRDTERFSELTGTFMIKLDEQSDDQYLKKGQITEEVIKSIDYDVWITDDKSDILILAYKRWISKYRKCPSCKHKTYFKEYDRTISAATYTSSGVGERKYSCKNCGHSKVSRYTIPKKTRSNTSSSSSGYSSGSSYSSSGGSSWGGGSSGGGGGGSSW